MKTYSCGSVSERHSAHIAAMALPALWLFLLNVGILSLFPSNAAAADKLIVGVSLPLSGGNASFGEASRKGFAMALKEDPKKFDKLDFRFSDNSYSASQAISSFNSLVSAENADVIYMWGSAPCLATAALAEKRSLPLICFAGDKKPGLSYVYGFVSPFSEYARPLAQVIRDRGFERIAVVYSEIPFLSSLAEALRVQVEARQLASFIGFAPTAQDFRSLILKFKQQRVDALVVFLLPDQIGPFIQQVKEQGMAPALIGTDTLTDPTVLGRDASLVQGALFSDIDISDEWLSAYVSEAGSSHNASFAANAYAFANLMAHIANKPGYQRGADLRDYLNGTKAEPACGSCSYHNDPEVGQYFAFPVVAKIIRGSDWERYSGPTAK